MREEQLDDRMGSEPVAGAYPDDGFPDDGFVEEGFVEEGGPGEAFVRDGMLVVPGGVVPTVPADGMPDWPPDVIPVALWPETTLRDALALGVPGAGLARVVAETTDPDAGLLADLSDDALGDLVVASGRLQSWAAGLQARVVAERAARETNPLALRRPGQTRAQNLQPLCRKHHLLKTHAGWGAVRDPATGTTTWTTPTGRTHTRPPTVLDTHIDLDQIDPDTSYHLTQQALTGQHLPRPYTTTEPGAIPATRASPPTPPTPTPPTRPAPAILRSERHPSVMLLSDAPISCQAARSQLR